MAIQLDINIDTDCLRAFIAKMRAHSPALSIGTQVLYLSALRRLLRWLAANDLLPTDFNWIKAETKLKETLGRATLPTVPAFPTQT